MHGVPEDLPIQQIVGDSLCQVCVGMDGIHFSFGRSGTISVGGRWELTDADGKIVDGACEYEERKAYPLSILLLPPGGSALLAMLPRWQSLIVGCMEAR